MKKLWALAPVFLITIILIGCVKEPAEVMPTQTKAMDTISPTKTEISPTEILTMTPTVTKTAIPSSKTPTPFERTTDFDASICDASDAEKKIWVESISAEENDCQYPCMFNHAFVVGDTKMIEAIANLSCVFGRPHRTIREIDGKSYKHYSFYWEGNEYWDSILTIEVVDDTVILAQGFERWDSSLNDILSEYGKPDGIWATALGGLFLPVSVGEYKIAFVYHSSGLVFESWGEIPNGGPFIEICESEFYKTPLNVTVISPEVLMNSEIEVLTEVFDPYGYPLAPYALLEDISNTDIDTFYEKYFPNDKEYCFMLTDYGLYDDPEMYGIATPIHTPTPTE